MKATIYGNMAHRFFPCGFFFFFFWDFEVTLMKKKICQGHPNGLQQSPCETNPACQGRDQGQCNTGTLLVPWSLPISKIRFERMDSVWNTGVAQNFEDMQIMLETSRMESLPRNHLQDRLTVRPRSQAGLHKQQQQLAEAQINPAHEAKVSVNFEEDSYIQAQHL